MDDNRLFISYAKRDQPWAEWAAWKLDKAGYSVELACWDWAPGENVVRKMHRALDSANRVIALFSQAYFEDMRYTTEGVDLGVEEGEASRRRTAVPRSRVAGGCARQPAWQRLTGYAVC